MCLKRLGEKEIVKMFNVASFRNLVDKKKGLFSCTLVV